jgi:hypothetical protein
LKEESKEHRKCVDFSPHFVEFQRLEAEALALNAPGEHVDVFNDLFWSWQRVWNSQSATHNPQPATSQLLSKIPGYYVFPSQK